MKVSEFDFELPKERIAARPASPRDGARLLEVTSVGLADRLVSELPACLRPGDLLVVNDTKVIPARLAGRCGAAGSVSGYFQGIKIRDGGARWPILSSSS